LGLDEVEARMSIDGGSTDELFGIPEVCKATESANATDARGDAQDVLIMNDTASEQGSEDEDSASDKDGDE
jgi:hypothetical protein